MKFLDTNYILKHYENLTERFMLASTTLHELEHIKTSRNKDEAVKFSARKAIHFLDDHPDLYDVVIVNQDVLDVLSSFGLENTPDNQICACAYMRRDEEVIFCSDDLCCKMIAKDVFGLEVISSKDEGNHEEYTGYVEKQCSDSEMAYLYEHMNENMYGLIQNQYLILKDMNDDIVDKLKWNGTELTVAKCSNIKTEYFGAIKPYNGDAYQQLALNSFVSNQVTMIKGPAGTGKSYLSMGYLFWLLEKRKIDKIIVFCNTVATANSAKLGFYPGTKDEKLLDSQIGNMLSSKLGGMFAVERLIEDGKLLLLPMSDIRGFDTSDMNAGVYITEAQNLDISLMKLALQRIGEDSVCIIDGDYNAQVDLSAYAGNNNGMRRMSEVFRGQDFYGEVELKNIYRSKIAKIAEMM